MNDESTTLDDLLTVREAAVRLRCSQTNVYALIGRGELPFVRVGAHKGYRIDPSDLLAFVRERKCAKRSGAKPPELSARRLKHIRI